MLFIGPLPEPVTGQSLACRVLLDGLPKHFRVELVDLTKREFRQGISSISRVREVLGILWRVWQRRRGADVIYFTISESRAGNLKDLLIYAFCFRRLHRMAIHLHGGAGMRGIMQQRRSALRQLNAFFLKRLGAAIVLGESQRGIYRGVVPDERIFAIPNCAEDYLFTTVERVAAKFERARPLRVLFLSNLLPGKGHEELVRAFTALNESAKAMLRVDFAGAFESERARAAFLASIDGEPRLQYQGAVSGEEKRALFDRAHIFCLPTYYPYEGQPISLLEAYASGCAVITTAHSGIPDIFRNGVNGLEVEMRSVAALGRAFEHAVQHPDQLKEMALTNLRAALAHYRTSQYQRAVQDVIESVARQ